MAELVTECQSRDTWIAERRTGIGSSDAAAVVGLCPFRTALSVYLDKLGLFPDRHETPAMAWGRRLEEVVAVAFAEETGMSLDHGGGLVRHRQWHWMIATPDRLTERGVLECKTARTAEGWGPPGTDQVPRSYMIQIQHQLEVLDMEQGWIAVLIGGQDFRVYEIPRCREIAASLIDMEGRFWRSVVAKDPPPFDLDHPQVAALVQLLHQPAPGTQVELDGLAQIEADEYLRLGGAITRATKERDRLKASLAMRMGSAASGQLPSGQVIRRCMRQRKGYTVPASTVTDFRVTGKDTRGGEYDQDQNGE